MRSALVLFLALALGWPARAAAHPSVSIVMDRNGNVFYSDLNRVWMVTPDGRKSIAVPNVHSHELFMDPAGNLYGEHLWYEKAPAKKWRHRIWKRSPDGSITDVIPPSEGFRSDYSFVRDTAGMMYFTARGPTLEIRKRKGAGTPSVHSRGPFADIRWMVAATDGSLYVIDGPDLKRILPDGTARPFAAGIGARSITRLAVARRHAVMGLWVDSAQNVYAARYGAGDVKRISQAGEIATVSRSPVPWSPTAVMTSPNGDLWILENSIINEVRLKRISSSGVVRYY